MSVRFEVDVPTEEISAALSRFTDLNPDQLLDPIGALVTSQTQRRIDKEKTAPDGTAWKPNSQGTDTLVKSGALRDTIDYTVSGTSVEVGSPMVYAAMQQFGGVIIPKDAEALVFSIGGKKVFAQKVEIPARPFLGLSAANRRELANLVETTLRRLVQ